LNLLDRLTVDPHNGQQRPAYVTVFVAGQKFVDHRSGQTIYLLGGGGDESKQVWFIRIGLGRDRVNDFLFEDEISPRPELWQNTFLGQLLPFRFVEYAARSEGFLRSQGPDAEWQNGFRGLYSYEVKYDDSSVDPMALVFASSGLTTPAKTQALEQFAGVLVYERINETQ
jgi:dolichyl-diphosphooligosaccharide--protein glycosyltransferase